MAEMMSACGVICSACAAFRGDALGVKHQKRAWSPPCVPPAGREGQRAFTGLEEGDEFGGEAERAGSGLNNRQISATDQASGTRQQMRDVRQAVILP